LNNIEIINRLSASAGMKDIKDLIKTRNNNVAVKLEPGLPESKTLSSHTGKLKDNKKLPFVFVREKSPHNYLNLELDRAIEGLNELVSPGYLLINQVDARRLDLNSGDEVTVNDTENELTRPFKVRKNIPVGVIFITDNNGVNGFKSNPCYVNLRRAHV